MKIRFLVIFLLVAVSKFSYSDSQLRINITTNPVSTENTFWKYKILGSASWSGPVRTEDIISVPPDWYDVKALGEEDSSCIPVDIELLIQSTDDYVEKDIVLECDPTKLVQQALPRDV